VRQAPGGSCLQLDDRADGGTSSGKCSKTVRTADSKSTTSDKALVSDEETAIVLAQPARFASEETMHGFLLKSFIGAEREPAADRYEGGAQDTRRGLSAHAGEESTSRHLYPRTSAGYVSCTCIHTCIHTYIHTCMYACIHTYILCLSVSESMPNILCE